MYHPTIGLEIHAELQTQTKMFCACLNNPSETRPNANICPVCMAHPGSLPVINKEAVRKVLLLGVAVGGRLADYTEFDRKNYFYPDIPKGYQISQFEHPLVAGGALAAVALTRVHLEEDTARSQHTGERSLVDFNRAGVPLMELVTEPVVTSARQAGDFARELQLLLRALGASDANMEKGEMRVEANISIAPEPQGLTLDQGSQKSDLKLGTKVEVKNLNSFRSMERAIDYEIRRQTALLEQGGQVVQETRGWDEERQATYTQRKKESSHDYRYFPDPDLPCLYLSELPEFSQERLIDALPELPSKRRERYFALGFLQAQDVDQLVCAADLADLFDRTAEKLKKAELVKIAANLILNDIAGQKKKDSSWPLPAADFLSAVVQKFYSGELSSPQVKSSIQSGTLAAAASGEEIPVLAKKVIDANPQVAEDYRKGKAVALQFLVGQGMRESKGSANPQALGEAIQKILGPDA